MKPLFKIGVFGDVHGQINTPESRSDYYPYTVLTKLNEISNTFKKENVDVSLGLGDLLEVDKVSWRYSNLITDALLEFPNLMMILGNHDFIGRNMLSIEDSPIGVLIKTKVFKPLLRGLPVKFDIGNKVLYLEGQEFYDGIDLNAIKDGIYKTTFNDGDYKIIAAHTNLLPVKVIDKLEHHLIKDVVTNADMILTGHYHPGFKETIQNDTIYANPGSVMRNARTDRQPQIMIVEFCIDKDKLVAKTRYIPLKTAKPSSEIFKGKKVTVNIDKVVKDFASIKKNMSKIKNGSGTDDIIALLNSNSKFDEEIRKSAVKLIDSCKEEVNTKSMALKGYVPQSANIYISSVELHNFKSYKDETITFINGMNVIYGSGDEGKSNVYKAIAFATYNIVGNLKKLIFIGETECYVKITYSNGTYIKRSRTLDDTGTWECFDGVKLHSYSKWGSKVPIAISNIHQMPKVNLYDKKDISINMSDQFNNDASNSMFLIGVSPQDNATAIGRISGILVIDTALKKVNKEIYDLNSKNEYNRKAIKKHETELKSYDYVDKYKSDIDETSKLITEYEDNTDFYNDLIDLQTELTNTYNSIADCKIEKDKYEHIDIVERYVKNYSSAISTANILTDLLEQQVDNSDMLYQCKMIKDFVPKEKEYSKLIDSYDKDLELLQKVYDLRQERVVIYRSKVKLEKDKESFKAIDSVQSMVDDYNTLLQEYSELQGYDEEIADINNKINVIKSDNKKSKLQIRILNNEITQCDLDLKQCEHEMLDKGICVLCGSKLDKEHFHL